MQEIISSILEAEKRADEIIDDAVSKSKSIKKSANEKAEDIKFRAIYDFKKEREKALTEASVRAERAYSSLLDEGTARADKAVKDAEVRLMDAVNCIVEEICK